MHDHLFSDKEFLITKCNSMLGAAISYSSDGSHRSDERSQVEVEGTRNILEAVPDDLVHLQHFIRSFLRICSPGKQ